MATTAKTKEKKSKGHSFWTTGEYMTNLIRSAWVEDNAKLAIRLCQDMSMNEEQSILTITGKKKLEGSTREGDGTLGWIDDNQTELHGISLSIEAMVERLEKQYIQVNEDINLFNGYIESDDSSSDEFSDNMKTLNGYKNKLPNILEQISYVYPLVKKSMKDLPVSQIRSAKQQKIDYKKEHPEEFETKERLTDYETRLSRSMKTLNNMSNSGSALDGMMEGIKKEREAKEKYDENDITRPFYTRIGGGGEFYIVHCDTKMCIENDLHAGWLLPDGTFYGGKSIWIHRGIIDELHERKFFKGKKYRADEDSVQDDGNWIKFSGGTWYIWEHKHQLTKEQVEFIIQYTTEVDNGTYFKAGCNNLIHISIFAKILNGEKFDEYEMAKESEPIIDKEREALFNEGNDGDEIENELKDFPTIEEVSKIDLLSQPFFQPDIKFAKWLIEYAKGRLIVDCGAGSGYLVALINKLGAKCIGLEPHYTTERHEFWNRQGFHFHVMFDKSETSSILKQSPPNGMLLLFARPCHSNFVYDTITNNMTEGTEALYISHKGNEKDDLREIKYTKIKHEGSSKDKEYVLSIKK